MTRALGIKQYGIIGLALATAIIHLVLGIWGLPDFLGIMFILNFFGYLTLAGALYLPLDFLTGMRGQVRWVFLGYTALTFVLYFVFNWPDIWGPLGLIDKAVELVLIILLWTEQV